MTSIVNTYKSSGTLVGHNAAVSGSISSGAIVPGNISSGAVMSGTMPISGFITTSHIAPDVVIRGVDWFIQRGINQYMKNSTGFGSGERWYIAGMTSRHLGTDEYQIGGDFLLQANYVEAIPYFSWRGGLINGMGVRIKRHPLNSGATMQIAIYANLSGTLWPSTKLTSSPVWDCRSGGADGVLSGSMLTYNPNIALEPGTLYWFAAGNDPVKLGPYVGNITTKMYSPFGVNKIYDSNVVRSLQSVYCFTNTYWSGNYPLPDDFPTYSGGLRWNNITHPAIAVRYASG